MMLKDKYLHNRTSKYLEDLDSAVKGILDQNGNKYDSSSILKANTYLKDLEHTIGNERDSFRETLIPKFNHLKSFFNSHIEKPININRLTRDITKTFIDFSKLDSDYSIFRVEDIGRIISQKIDTLQIQFESRSFNQKFSEWLYEIINNGSVLFHLPYSLKDIGDCIHEKIDILKTKLDEAPSSFEREFLKIFYEIVTLNFLYGIKHTFSSDDYFTLENDISNSMKCHNELKKFFVLCKRYKDIGCRLWTVRYFKRCNYRLLTLEDIKYNEFNYLIADEEGKEEFKKDKSAKTNEITKQIIIDKLTINAIKRGKFYDSENDEYYQFLRKKKSKDGPVIVKRIAEYIKECHSDKVEIEKRQIKRKINVTISKLKKREIELKKGDLKHDIYLYDIVM